MPRTIKTAGMHDQSQSHDEHDPKTTADRLDSRTRRYLRCNHAIEQYLHDIHLAKTSLYNLAIELGRMKKGRLYLVQYKSFKEYLDDAHDLSDTWANNLIRMTSIYTLEDVQKGSLCTTHMLILATAGLHDSVRRDIEVLIDQLRPGKVALEQAVKAAQEARDAGRSREEQKQAARGRLEMLAKLKHQRAAERKAHAERARASKAAAEETARRAGWFEMSAGMDFGDYQACAELRLGLRDALKKVRALLPVLSVVVKGLAALPGAEFVGPEPLALWENLHGLHGQLPRILAELLGHFRGAKLDEVTTQVVAEPEIAAAVAVREARVAAEQPARDAERALRTEERARSREAALGRERVELARRRSATRGAGPGGTHDTTQVVAAQAQEVADRAPEDRAPAGPA